MIALDVTLHNYFGSIVDFALLTHGLMLSYHQCLQQHDVFQISSSMPFRVITAIRIIKFLWSYLYQRYVNSICLCMDITPTLTN
jgi:hypothetical protein